MAPQGWVTMYYPPEMYFKITSNTLTVFQLDTNSEKLVIPSDLSLVEVLIYQVPHLVVRRYIV